MSYPDIRFGGVGGAHEMRLNVKGTVGSFGGRKLIYNKIITRKIVPPLPPPLDPSLNNKGTRCSSVVRAFARGAMGRRIDPS